jgi:hypothetical protein
MKNKIGGNKKEKGILDNSHSYPHYTASKSCFAKRFSKTDSAPPTESAPPAQPQPELCQTNP